MIEFLLNCGSNYLNFTGYYFYFLLCVFEGLTNFKQASNCCQWLVKICFCPLWRTTVEIQITSSKLWAKSCTTLLGLRLTEQVVSSGTVSDLYSVRAGSNTSRHKTLLFVIFLSPSEKTSRGYLQRGYNRFLPHRLWFIHYSLHLTVQSHELPTASWNKTKNRKCSVQIGGAQHFSIGQLTTKVVWHSATRVFKTH